MQLEDKEHQRAWLMCEKQEERVDQAQLWFAHLAALLSTHLQPIISALR